jgi:hypothetical protein
MLNFGDKLKALGLRDSTEAIDPFAGLAVTHKTDTHSVTTKVSGPASVVEAWFRDYQNRYCPSGYMTSIKKRVLKGDTLYITVWRSRSCD